jgi:hypothetical protein
VKVAPDEFADMLLAAFRATFGEQVTVEEVLVQPREANRFCDSVRQRFGYPDLPDGVILQSLLRTEQGGGVAGLATAFHWLGLGLLLLLALAAYWLGSMYHFLFFLPLAALPVLALHRVWAAFRGGVAWHFLRSPLRTGNRRYLLPVLSQWAFWLLLALAVNLSIFSFEFAAEELAGIRVMLWGCVGALLALALIPNIKTRVSTNVFCAGASLYLLVELVSILGPVPAVGAVVLDPPFRGRWYVASGGPSVLINHHRSSAQTRHGVDFLKLAAPGRTGTDPARIESYAAFGEMLYAPAGGRVVTVVDDRPDVQVGESDWDQILGNHVVIDVGQGKYVLMAHLMRGSVIVQPGEDVQSGQAIARCGNSGFTGEPHLHLQVQSDGDFWAPGLRTYPLRLRGAVRERRGRHERLESADLRRNDVLIVGAEGLDGR